MAPTQYGGYLYSKRKSELEEIATALNIELPDQPYVKSDRQSISLVRFGSERWLTAMGEQSKT